MEQPELLADRMIEITVESHRGSGTAILIVDMIADFEFKDGQEIFEQALPVARNIAGLKLRTNNAAVPVIYVNDNYGMWKHDFAATVEAAERSPRGAPILSLIRPGAEDYHVLKPQHSGFFATPLAVTTCPMF